MITEYKLINFESWKDFHIRLHPGVNAFVGASDMGKSGLLRGLNWPINNKPGGDSFRSTWGGETSSILVFDDGSIVERGKSGKTKNYYKYTIDGKEEELLAFGASVPDEIKQLINMGKINQQFQMDTPFLLSNEYSPGKVASWLNKAADLEIIDSSLSYINSKQKYTKTELAKVESLKDEYEDDLKELYFIDGAEGELFVLENLEIEVNDLRRKIKTIRISIVSIEENEEKQKEYIAVLALSAEVDRLLSLKLSIEQSQTKQGKLQKIISTLENNHKLLITYNETIQAEKEVIRLQKIDADCNKLSIKTKKLSRLIREIESNNALLTSKNESIRELQEKFDALMPDVCPLCGAKE